MRNFIFLAALTLGVAGCGPAYILDGKRYESTEAFFQAADLSRAEALASVSPLPRPVTQKKLIFAIPSERAAQEESAKRAAVAAGPVANQQFMDQMRNVTTVNWKSIAVLYDAVVKRNIYASTEFVTMETMNGSYAASETADALYYTEPAQGSAQWFYVSAKGGRQIFAFDRSPPTPAGKTRTFLEAVQAHAIRE